MEVREITNKDEWDAKMSSHEMSQFLQSWEWGEIQKSLGNTILRIAIGNYFFLLIKRPLPFGLSYILIPRTSSVISREILQELRSIAQREHSIFLRIEPVGAAVPDGKQVADHDPSRTIVLDLRKSEEDLLSDMHQKTRYNIRLAEKKGVTVRRGTGEDLDIFYGLITETFSRKHKTVFSKSYFDAVLKSSLATLYIAENDGIPLAANIVTFYGDTVTYKDGGTSSQHKELMAPQLLQWQQIREAKAAGYIFYDLWGIDEQKYPGVTRFKKGFGGTEIQYPGTFDVPVHRTWYSIYSLIKTII